MIIRIALFAFCYVLSIWSYSQEKEIEGMWLACVSESDCDDSKSGVYIKFENGTMTSYVKASGLDPIKYGDPLNYVWDNGELVVTKEGSPYKDRYIIKIEKNKMVMTHTSNKSSNYLEKR